MHQGDEARVLIAGAINTDLVATMRHPPEAGETITGHGFSMFGGGKGANQAVAVARSGGRVVLVGAVGIDTFGTARLTDLQNDGINTEWIKAVESESSGVALILVEESGENRIVYVPGATSTVTATDILAAYEATSPTVVLVPNEVQGAALAALLSRARADGVLTILNATPDPLTVLPLLSDVSILIVNEHEAAQMLGHGVSGHQEAARKLGELHGITVLVTAGGDGVFCWDGSRVFQIRGPARSVVDTTGAGDTFAGAMAARIAGGAALQDAVEFGVHAAGISVTRPGAQSSIPIREEVERSLIAVESL